MPRPTRTPRPPLRLKGSFDEFVPSLAVLRRINARADLEVEVTEVPFKGLGVVARRPIPAGTLVARYEFKVVRKAHASPGDYRVGVDANRVGKIDARTFSPPTGAIANVGALLNEPNEGEAPNCRRLASRYWGAPSSRRGAFHLQTTRDVPAGEELTWDYGPSYGRRVY